MALHPLGFDGEEVSASGRHYYLFLPFAEPMTVTIAELPNGDLRMFCYQRRAYCPALDQEIDGPLHAKFVILNLIDTYGGNHGTPEER
jgi:hypothetical protein